MGKAAANMARTRAENRVKALKRIEEERAERSKNSEYFGILEAARHGPIRVGNFSMPDPETRAKEEAAFRSLIARETKIKNEQSFVKAQTPVGLNDNDRYVLASQKIEGTPEYNREHTRLKSAEKATAEKAAAEKAAAEKAAASEKAAAAEKAATEKSQGTVSQSSGTSQGARAETAGKPAGNPQTGGTGVLRPRQPVGGLGGASRVGGNVHPTVVMNNGRTLDATDTVNKNAADAEARADMADSKIERMKSRDRYSSDSIEMRRLAKGSKMDDDFHAAMRQGRIDGREFSTASDWNALAGVADGKRDYEQFANHTVKDVNGNDVVDTAMKAKYDEGKAKFDSDRNGRIMSAQKRAAALLKRFNNGENQGGAEHFRRLMKMVGNPFAKDPATGKYDKSRIRDDFKITDAQLEALEKTIGDTEKATDRWKTRFDSRMAGYEQAYDDKIRSELGPAGQYIKDRKQLRDMYDKRQEAQKDELLGQLVDSKDAVSYNEALGKLRGLKSTVDGSGNSGGFNTTEILQNYMSGGEENVERFNDMMNRVRYSEDYQSAPKSVRSMMEDSFRNRFAAGILRDSRKPVVAPSPKPDGQTSGSQDNPAVAPSPKPDGQTSEPLKPRSFDSDVAEQIEKALQQAYLAGKTARARR